MKQTPEQKEIRKLKKELQVLTDDILLFLREADAEMVKPASYERGQRLSKAFNALSMCCDASRHFSLGIPLTSKKLKQPKYARFLGNLQWQYSETCQRFQKSAQTDPLK